MNSTINRQTLCTTKKLSSENVQCLKTDAKDLYPILFKTNTIIKLFASRCRIRKTTRTMAKISKYHILENKNKGRDICHKILIPEKVSISNAFKRKLRPTKATAASLNIQKFIKQLDIFKIKWLHSTCKKKWIFISKDDWCTTLIKFIEEKENSLIPWTKPNRKRNIGTYTLISSSSSLRALFIARCIWFNTTR
ncbi:uncharacterized protein LOC112552195 [Pogonomyrmex barbatus]|uniref:Uncharacterized protein LOC112552195 n=1 Tax=Pogonomyrmex barbatus TaxID=144034 RepID=A0A8N1SC86_9HYME|nr:uncharacterized protein LOC112552195 [Pogonomyrmex barbatus]